MPRNRLTKEARRERTIDRVGAVFARKGIRGATSRDLARAAGVSEALVFKLFGSKRGLFQAIVERKIERGGGEAFFPREAAEREDDEEVLSAIAGQVLANMEADPTFLRLFLFSALEGGELAAMFVEARIQRALDFLAGYLRRRMRRGALSRGDPELAALFFVGMVVQYVMARQVLAVRGLDGRDREEVSRTAVRIFLAGLRPAHRRGGKSK